MKFMSTIVACRDVITMVFQISEKKKLQLSKVAKFLAATHILEGHFEVPSKSKHIPFSSMQLSKFIILTFI